MPKMVNFESVGLEKSDKNQIFCRQQQQHTQRENWKVSIRHGQMQPVGPDEMSRGPAIRWPSSGRNWSKSSAQTSRGGSKKSTAQMSNIHLPILHIFQNLLPDHFIGKLPSRRKFHFIFSSDQHCNLRSIQSL